MPRQDHHDATALGRHGWGRLAGLLLGSVLRRIAIVPDLGEGRETCFDAALAGETFNAAKSRLFDLAQSSLRRMLSIWHMFSSVEDLS